MDEIQFRRKVKDLCTQKLMIRLGCGSWLQIGEVGWEDYCQNKETGVKDHHEKDEEEDLELEEFARAGNSGGTREPSSQ